MTISTIDSLPVAPSRSDPSTFDSKADAFLGALPTLVSQMNTTTGEIDTVALQVSYDADAAAASEVAAGLSEAAAAASALAAVNAPGTTATSSTSLTIGTGAKSLTIQTGKTIVVGMTMKIAYTTTPTSYMLGTVTGYNSGTGVLDVTVSGFDGSGTFADWTVSLAPTGGVTLTGSETLTNKTLSTGTNFASDALALIQATSLYF